MKTFEVCKIFRRGFVVVVVSFAAAFLCAADVRAEQPGATQKWPAEKILIVAPDRPPMRAAGRFAPLPNGIRSRRFDPRVAGRLGKDAPLGRDIERSVTIIITPILPGRHHCYARI